MSMYKSLESELPSPDPQNTYPEFRDDQRSDDKLLNSNTNQSADTEFRGDGLTTWATRMLARSPDIINAKRNSLLSGSRRTSSDDLESQVSSTDDSTLFEDDRSGQDISSSNTSRPRVNPRLISDAIIGLSDGLTVPFALTAGLSTLGSTNVVIYAGLAELCAGAISMGLGGYLGAKSEEESFAETRSVTASALTSTPFSTLSVSTASIFAPYHLPSSLLAELTAHMSKLPNKKQLEFLMSFEHQLPATADGSSRAWICALTIALGYFLGGFIPLLPYFFVSTDQVMYALWWSLGVMSASLFAFGYGKTCFVSGWKGLSNVCAGCRGGIQMLVVGGVAAGCAMGLVRLFHNLTT